MELNNYFLFIVGVAFNQFLPGDCGVGRTSLSPGIRDEQFGTLYVIPESAVRHNAPDAHVVKYFAFKYFGIK